MGKLTLRGEVPVRVLTIFVPNAPASTNFIMSEKTIDKFIPSKAYTRNSNCSPRRRAPERTRRRHAPPRSHPRRRRRKDPLRWGHRRPFLAGFALLHGTPSASVNMPDAEAAAVRHRELSSPRIGLLRDGHSHKSTRTAKKGLLETQSGQFLISM